MPTVESFYIYTAGGWSMGWARISNEKKQVCIHEISRELSNLCSPPLFRYLLTFAHIRTTKKKRVTDRRTDGRTHPLIES